MKFTNLSLTLALASLLPLTIANPLPTEIFDLEKRAGPYCHTTGNNQECYKGAGALFNVKRYVDHAENAGGMCKAYDDRGYVL